MKRKVTPRVRVVPISRLVLDGKNANKGTKRGRVLLGESLERYGAGRSVVVDRHDRVIAGNKTVEAAVAAGMKSIAVIETDGSALVAVRRGDLDLKKDKKARELAIADNRVSEIDLEWNPEVLASLDVDLEQFWDEGELNALLKDFRTSELSAPEPKLDQAAELQKKWKTSRGQIGEIGRHRLMCGDSSNSGDVQALMDGKTAKLCATDPPYLVSYDAKNHPSKNFSDGKNKDWKGRYADKQKSEPLGPFYEAFLGQALSVCEDDAAIYVWHASQRQIEVEKAMRDCGILVHQQIIWVKNKPVLTHSFYMWQHEPCFFGWKQGHKPKRNSGSFPTTVWQIDVPVLPGKESRHPTEKPLELFATPILLHTKPDDVCYEPFSGSGSHLCAAENTHRRCFAMEIEPVFVAVALERLAEMKLKPKCSPPGCRREIQMAAIRKKTGFRGPTPEVGKPFRWKKGQSGNPSGRPKSKVLSDAYKQKLEERVPNDPEGRTWAELIAEAQVRDAVRGDVQAAREIADRTEGRARQAIEFEDTTIAKAFQKMNNKELETYARDGTLPAWFPRTQNRLSMPHDEDAIDVEGRDSGS